MAGGRDPTHGQPHGPRLILPIPAMTSSCSPEKKQGVGSRGEEEGAVGGGTSRQVPALRPPFAAGGQVGGRHGGAGAWWCKSLRCTALYEVANPVSPPRHALGTRRREKKISLNAEIPMSSTPRRSVPGGMSFLMEPSQAQALRLDVHLGGVLGLTRLACGTLSFRRWQRRPLRPRVPLMAGHAASIVLIKDGAVICAETARGRQAQPRCGGSRKLNEV